MQEAGDRVGRRPAGRPLSVDALFETGVAGLLLSGGVDVPTLAAELAGYLAGPAIPTWTPRSSMRT